MDLIYLQKKVGVLKDITIKSVSVNTILNLKSKIETKEDAKRQFLIDTLTKEKDFDKIDVLKCYM